MLRFMGSQRVRHDWATELNWTENYHENTDQVKGDLSLSQAKGGSRNKTSGPKCNILKFSITNYAKKSDTKSIPQNKKIRGQYHWWYSLEKTLMLGKIEGRRRRGRQRMRWLDGITDAMDMSLSRLQVGDGHLIWRTDSLEKTLRGCWERLKVGGEGDDRGWDGWMSSLTQWTGVWANSGVGDGQRSLACWSPWGHKELDRTEWLNWTELRCSELLRINV